MEYLEEKRIVRTGVWTQGDLGDCVVALGAKDLPADVNGPTFTVSLGVILVELLLRIERLEYRLSTPTPEAKDE